MKCCFPSRDDRPRHDDESTAPTPAGRERQISEIDSPNSRTNGGLLEVCAELKYGTFTYQDVAKLLDQGADPNAKDPITNNRALHHTCNVTSKDREENFETATILLLDRGADVSAPGWCDSTPLHKAATVSHVPTVSLLIERKANLEAEDSNKHRPLHLAALGGFVPCVQKLLIAKADMNARDKDGKAGHHRPRLNLTLTRTLTPTLTLTLTLALDLARQDGKQQVVDLLTSYA